MAADLHIHVFDGLTEDVLRDAFRNTLGSKYFGGGMGFAGLLTANNSDSIFEAHDKIIAQPNIWIGSVSWLKAALTEDRDFVPNTVQAVYDAIGEDLPVLDGELYERILGAFSEENTTGYSLAKVEDVRAWLQENRGKRLFTVSW